MASKGTIIRKLSSDFTKDVYKDGVRKYILPGKILLQSVCCWPGSETIYMRIGGWFLFWNLCVAEIFHAAYVFKNFKNIGDAVQAGATVTTTMEALLRLYIMLRKKDVINDILVKVWRQFWSLDIVEQTKRKELQRKIQISAVLACSFLAFSSTSNTKITSTPFISNHALIFKSVFPFEWNQTYVYEIIYIWQYYSDWYVLFMVNAFDFFFIALVIICAMQFIIMEDVLKCILTKESKRHRKVIFGDTAENITDNEVLSECLEHHKLLLGICNDLESSFNMAILIQFFVSTSAICAASLVLKVDYSQFFKMLMYAAAHLTQLFYFCYVGNELTFQSGHLSDAIYECNWHLFYDKSFRKALVLMIQRSQKVQCLTAAGIMELDFISFLKILRLSFSFYTLLDNLLMKNFKQ